MGAYRNFSGITQEKLCDYWLAWFISFSEGDALTWNYLKGSYDTRLSSKLRFMIDQKDSLETLCFFRDQLNIILSNTKLKSGIYTWLRFSIGQHSRDLLLLESLVNFFGFWQYALDSFVISLEISIITETSHWSGTFGQVV